MRRFTFRLRRLGMLFWLMGGHGSLAQEPPIVPPRGAAAEIQSMLRSQVAAWNAGDITGFMQYYWNSDDLTFSSGGQTTHGWSATLRSYQQRYPSPAAMGQVQFNDLRVRSLGPDAALTLGRWQLRRTGGDLQGNFTLVLQRLEGKWRIIHDHTSRSDPDAPE